jgi:hypothetical protein
VGWVTYQRALKREDKLDEEQIEALEGLGVVWDPREDGWEEKFQVSGRTLQEPGSTGSWCEFTVN